MTKVSHTCKSGATRVRLYKRFPVLIQGSGPWDLRTTKFPTFKMAKYGKTGSPGGIVKVAVM